MLFLTNIWIFFSIVVTSKKMGYLLCFAIFNTDKELIQHCVSYHRVDVNNRFYQKLFQQTNNSTILRKCLRCNDFITTRHHKIKHDFLKHYDEGQTDLYEDKSNDIIKLLFMTKYEISIMKHGEYYNFFNSEEVVDNFFKNVRSKFKPSVLKHIKGAFVIENIQPSAVENSAPISNSRFWSTDVYKGFYFNDFIFNGLKHDILNKVIINGMTGNSWRFHRFITLTVKVLNLDRDIVK